MSYAQKILHFYCYTCKAYELTPVRTIGRKSSGLRGDAVRKRKPKRKVRASRQDNTADPSREIRPVEESIENTAC